MSAAVLMLSAGLLSGCSADEPFGGREGEGELRMRMVINSDVTRASMDADTENTLRSECVVYISDPQKGLLHKFKGLENVPESLKMKSGSYVAEAWTGDSVSASFDKKFFRGYQPFQVGQGVTQVVVNCKIANVVASVNAATVDPELVKDMKISVSNSKGELIFDESNYDFAKGYFMMPSSDNSLSYTITGKNIEGQSFEKSGVIGNVQRAHEYVLNFAYNPDYEALGGSFITVTIDDTEIEIMDEVEILSRPSVSLVNGDINRQIVGEAGQFTDDLIVKISSFGGVKNVFISSMQADELNLPMGDGQEIDLTNMTPSSADAVSAAHISHDITYNEKRNLATCFLVFSREFLNKIPEAPEEYVIHLSTEDEYGKSTVKDIRIAVGDAAVTVDDPVVIGDIASSDLLAVGSRSARIPVSIASEDAVNPGVRYREAGTSDWQEVYLGNASSLVRKASRKAPAESYVSLTELKPSTRYEIQAIADGFNSESRYITTESVFAIPNSSMEEWSNYVSNRNVLMPSADGQSTFWDTGNHGAAKASAVLTESSSVMSHSGSVCASLTTKFASILGIGKLAAGNLFAGTYVKTDGTDGVLEFGRQYDGSHPSSMRLWVNYRPKVGVNKKGADSSYIAEGALDEGQIYVALSTEPVEIRTKKSDRKLFDPNENCIVAYGEYTFKEDYGADGSLQQLDIPIQYYDKARTVKPLYLIIVCSASKYGDYYSGGEGSQMYVDDFELIYE